MQKQLRGTSVSSSSEIPRGAFKRRRAATRALALGVVTVSACGTDMLTDDQPSSLSQALIVTATFQNGANGYTGTTDTEIRQASPAGNYGNATTCNVDGDDGSGVDKSCLVRWNVTGIPAGATVTSASITLRVVDATANTYPIYALKRSFQEGSATWNNAGSSQPWQAPGALGANDRGAQIGTITGNGTVTVNLNSAGIAAVQSWVAGAQNAGIVIASGSNTDGIDLASSEHGTASYRPKLTITYDTGAGGAGGATGTGGASGASGAGSGAAGGGSTEPNLLIAFIGDQGANGNSDRVLELIAAEGAAATIHNGDFDYADDPSAWNSRIDRILGANYPYFAVVGNHDAAAWNGANGYGSTIAARHARVPAMNCQGDLGVKATCRFRGLFLVTSCVGTSELSGHGNCSKDSAEQVGFIRDSLAADTSIWSICAWHKNQNDMQIGTKGDEVGWSAYRECQNAGAIVSTGHEHSYGRTLTLSNVGNRSAGHGALGAFDSVELRSGRTFVFVSGLAGVGVRNYSASQHDDDTWWASQYAANRWMKNGVVQSGTGTYGALFVRFNVNGDPRRATAYFKDVNGRLVDEFTIRAP